MPAGYSGTPLLMKLGLKDGMKAYAYEPCESLVTAANDAKRDLIILRSISDCPEDCDFIHVFLTDKVALETSMPFLKSRIRPAGMIWVSWPKKASKVATEIDGNDVRVCALATGLVDVKVCAVDEVWSGLKFVIRVNDRK